MHCMHQIYKSFASSFIRTQVRNQKAVTSHTDTHAHTHTHTHTQTCTHTRTQNKIITHSGTWTQTSTQTVISPCAHQPWPGNPNGWGSDSPRRRSPCPASMTPGWGTGPPITARCFPAASRTQRIAPSWNTKAECLISSEEKAGCRFSFIFRSTTALARPRRGALLRGEKNMRKSYFHAQSKEKLTFARVFIFNPAALHSWLRGIPCREVLLLCIHDWFSHIFLLWRLSRSKAIVHAY